MGLIPDLIHSLPSRAGRVQERVRGLPGAVGHGLREVWVHRRLAEAATALALGVVVIVGNAPGTPVPSGPAPGFTPLPTDNPYVTCLNVPPAQPIYAGTPNGPKAPKMVDRGPVLPDAKFVNVYVGPYWNTPDGQARRQAIDEYTWEYTVAPINDVLAQYGAPYSEYGTSVVLPQVAPTDGDIVTTDQIASQLAGGVAPDQVHPESGSLLKQGLSVVGDGVANVRQSVAGTPLGPVTVYNEIFEPGTRLSGDANAGYHFDATGPQGRAVPYTVEIWPTQTGPVLSQSASDSFDQNALDSFDQTFSHEMDEVRTDPYFPTGWVTAGTNAYEVGDVADFAGALVQCDSNGNVEQPIYSPFDNAYEVQPASDGP